MSTYYFLPTRNVFGEGAVNEIGALLGSLNVSHAMIVTDKFLAQSGMAASIQEILSGSGIRSVVFDGAEPNPTDKNVEAGVAFFQQNGCDSIISLGGGSSHDCAKGIGLVASNGGRIHDYEGVDKASRDVVPLMAINTTAGTASEITRFCIITDTSRKVKMAIVDWRVTPKIAVNDPVLMKGMPASLTAATGMDAMTHAIEAYVSTLHCDYTDPLALHAIKMISRDLVDSYNGDMAARDRMHNAQCLAGMAFSNALLGIVHSMAHKTGAAFSTGHITHGLANAMYLPYVIAYNAKADGVAERYADIARTMGVVGDTTAELVEGLRAKIRSMNDAMGIPNTLKDFGIIEDEFKEKLTAIATNAVGDACTGSNPRPIDPETMAKLFTCIYYGEEVNF